jgi:RNA polymerase sigma factor (sigma-70 family)
MLQRAGLITDGEDAKAEARLALIERVRTGRLKPSLVITKSYIRKAIEWDFIDSARRQISKSSEKTACPYCRGQGYVDDPKCKCTRCAGKGKMWVPYEQQAEDRLDNCEDEVEPLRGESNDSGDPTLATELPIPDTLPLSRNVVSTAMDYIDEKTKRILRLCYWKDLDEQEIATTLSITQGAVSQRLKAAKSQIGRIIKALLRRDPDWRKRRFCRVQLVVRSHHFENTAQECRIGRGVVRLDFRSYGHGESGAYDLVFDKYWQRAKM